jgi:tyrosyl-tRNA synthetase
MGNVNIVDNYSWWESLSLTDFMNDIAKNMRVGQMLGRER